MPSSVESRGESTYNPDRLLGVAVELQRWVAQLPKWNPAELETWTAYSERHRQSEERLVALLRRLPSCRVILSNGGQDVELTLAGLHVRSTHGLSATCQLWITRAKRQSAP